MGEAASRISGSGWQDDALRGAAAGAAAPRVAFGAISSPGRQSAGAASSALSSSMSLPPPASPPPRSAGEPEGAAAAASPFLGSPLAQIAVDIMPHRMSKGLSFADDLEFGDDDDEAGPGGEAP